MPRHLRMASGTGIPYPTILEATKQEVSSPMVSLSVLQVYFNLVFIIFLLALRIMAFMFYLSQVQPCNGITAWPAVCFTHAAASLPMVELPYFQVYLVPVWLISCLGFPASFSFFKASLKAFWIQRQNAQTLFFFFNQTYVVETGTSFTFPLFQSVKEITAVIDRRQEGMLCFLFDRSGFFGSCQLRVCSSFTCAFCI